MDVDRRKFITRRASTYVYDTFKFQHGTERRAVPSRQLRLVYYG